MKNDITLQNALWFLVKDTVKNIILSNGSTKAEEPVADKPIYLVCNIHFTLSLLPSVLKEKTIGRASI